MWAAEVPFAPRRWPIFYGWVILFAGTVAVLSSVPGQTIGVGVFTEPLMEALGLSRSQLSLAYLIGTMASGFLLPWAGKLYDRWGGRKLLVGSTLALAGSLLYLSLSEELSRGLAALLPATAAGFAVVTLGFFVLRFTGQGMVTMTGRNLIAKWFNRKRGLAIGISGTAVSICFSAGPVGLNAIVQGFGWKGAWVFMAVLLVVFFAGLGWLFARDNPEECGLEMDGGQKGPLKEETNQDLIIKRPMTRAEALRTRSFWIYNFTFGLHALGTTAYVFHVVDIGKTLAVSTPFILSLFFYASFVGVAANLLTGWISGLTRVKYLLAVENFAAVLLWISLLLVPVTGLWMLALFVLGWGVSGGIWGNLMGNVFARFYGRDHLGAITGVVMSTTVISSALGPYAFGLARELTGAYAPALIGSAAIAAVLFAFSFAGDNPQRMLKEE
ncbi:MAG: MFS transporter [Verrucomicrobia bacterium]|jgi:MFS family permease|nr:MFS transporter [Verrucomicrobiota bacterium]